MVWRINIKVLMYYSHLIILLFLYYCNSTLIFILKANSLVQVRNSISVPLSWKLYFNKKRTNIRLNMSAEIQKEKKGKITGECFNLKIQFYILSALNTIWEREKLIHWCFRWKINSVKIWREKIVIKNAMQVIQNSHSRQFLKVCCFVVKKSHIINYRH